MTNYSNYRHLLFQFFHFLTKVLEAFINDKIEVVKNLRNQLECVVLCPESFSFFRMLQSDRKPTHSKICFILSIFSSALLESDNFRTFSATGLVVIGCL